MRRKLMLPALAACCLLAVGAPMASAHKARAAHKAHASSVASKVHKLGAKVSGIAGAVAGVNHTIQQIKDIDLGQTAAINRNIDAQTSLKGTVDAIVAGVPAIVDGLTQLKNGLTTLGTAVQTQIAPGLKALADAVTNTIGPGLTALSTAVQDPSSGLVGLNLARTQFAAFDSAGVFKGGTTSGGAAGPATDANNGSLIGKPGLFVVDFGANNNQLDGNGDPYPNATDQRFLSVTPFPGSAAAGVPQAVACDASVSAAATCYGVENHAAPNPANQDNDPNHVLVEFGDGSAAPAAGFEISAISG